MEWKGHPVLSGGKHIETETTTWSKFLNGGKVIAEQILELQERHEFKKAGLWESQSEIGVEKSNIWVMTSPGLSAHSPGLSALPE